MRLRPSMLIVLPLLVGCEAVLGLRELSDTSASQTDGGVADSGAVECRFPADCPKIATIPTGCATATCTDNKCVFIAVDGDGDGHGRSDCVVPTEIAFTPGDDCDDSDSDLYPGHSTKCSEGPDGGKIVYPGGLPQGECKFGSRSCLPSGKVSECTGAVLPKAELCTGDGLDEDCDGNPLNGCPCKSGDITACGHAAVGICKPGASLCDSGGLYGACNGNIEPAARKCGSSQDNDCDGKPDNTIDTVCQCSPGTTSACNAHPGKDGVGACKSGQRSCMTTASGSAWSACSGDVAPRTDGCAVDADYDCDGINGNEASCTILADCSIMFDWIRGPNCQGAVKIFTTADGNSLGVQECSNGATPATIYRTTDPTCGPGFQVRFVGYVKSTSGGAGWIGFAGGYTLQ